jgi:hypothetical protein
MVKIKYNCDRSGKHGFSLTGVFDVNDEQYQDFVHNFARGQKAICYLGALAMYRGTESFDWFTRTMPDNVPVVDGMEAANDQDEEEARARASSGKKSRVGSSRGPPRSIVINDDDGFGETAIDRLAAALHGGESPERCRYYRARAEQIELKNKVDSETEDLRILSSRAEESRKAMVVIVGGLKDVSAAKELSNLAPSVQEKLNSVESNFETLLASLNTSMSDANSRKRSRDQEQSMSGDESE